MGEHPFDRLAKARKELSGAEARVAAAQDALAEARVALDVALADVGWRRLNVAGGPGIAIYVRPGNDNGWPLQDVLALLDQEAALQP